MATNKNITFETIDDNNIKAIKNGVTLWIFRDTENTWNVQEADEMPAAVEYPQTLELGRRKASAIKEVRENFEGVRERIAAQIKSHEEWQKHVEEVKAEEERKKAEEERQRLANIAKVREGLTDGAPLASFSWQEIENYLEQIFDDNIDRNSCVYKNDEGAARLFWAVRWCREHLNEETAEAVIFDDFTAWGRYAETAAESLVSFLRKCGFTRFILSSASTALQPTLWRVQENGARLVKSVKFTECHGWSKSETYGVLFEL